MIHIILWCKISLSACLIVLLAVTENKISAETTLILIWFSIEIVCFLILIIKLWNVWQKCYLEIIIYLYKRIVQSRYFMKSLFAFYNISHFIAFIYLVRNEEFTDFKKQKYVLVTLVIFKSIQGFTKSLELLYRSHNLIQPNLEPLENKLFKYFVVWATFYKGFMILTFAILMSRSQNRGQFNPIIRYFLLWSFVTVFKPLYIESYFLPFKFIRFVVLSVSTAYIWVDSFYINDVKNYDILFGYIIFEIHVITINSCIDFLIFFIYHKIYNQSILNYRYDIQNIKRVLLLNFPNLSISSFPGINQIQGVGLSPEEIQNLIKEKNDEILLQDITNCTICKLEIDLEISHVSLECSHKFHINCITKWLKEKAVCPNCRNVIKTKKSEFSKSSIII